MYCRKNWRIKKYNNNEKKKSRTNRNKKKTKKKKQTRALKNQNDTVDKFFFLDEKVVLVLF